MPVDLVDKTPRRQRPKTSRERSDQETKDHAPTDPEAGGVDGLLNSERRFHLAFENNMTGTVLLDPDRKILEANDALCQMLGYNTDEIVGKQLGDVHPPRGPRHLRGGPPPPVLGRGGQGELSEALPAQRRAGDRRRGVEVRGTRRIGRDALLRLVDPGRHGGTGPQCPALPPGAARLAHGACQPGAVREPALPSSREDCAPGRVERFDVVGPR